MSTRYQFVLETPCMQTYEPVKTPTLSSFPFRKENSLGDGWIFEVSNCQFYDQHNLKTSVVPWSTGMIPA